jgi:hypothetical protein
MCVYSIITNSWGKIHNSPTQLPSWPSSLPPDMFRPQQIPLHKLTPAIAAKMFGAADCLLNEKEKKQFVDNLRRIAGKPCECD